MKTMKATVFHGTNDIRVEEVSRLHAGVGEAAIRVTLTTICGTDFRGSHRREGTPFRVSQSHAEHGRGSDALLTLRASGGWRLRDAFRDFPDNEKTANIWA